MAPFSVVKLHRPEDPEHFYIGGTTQRVSQLLAGYRYNAGVATGSPLNKHFNTVGWDGVVATVLEQRDEPCVAAVREWIERLRPTLNGCRRGVTDEEKRARLLERSRRRHASERDYRLEKVACSHCHKSVCRVHLPKHITTQHKHATGGLSAFVTAA